MSTNRNQRRLQDKAAGKKAGGPTKKTQADAAQIKAEAMALKAAGKEAEAIPLLTEALRLDPSLADAHFTLAMMARTKPELGIDLEAINRGVKNRKTLSESYRRISKILSQKKLHQEALVCQEELCRLSPNDEIEQSNLAILSMIAGKRESALRIMAGMTLRNPKNHDYKTLFIRSCGPVQFSAEEPLIARALQTCFDNIYDANLSKAYDTWITTALYHPACKGLRQAEQHCRNEKDFTYWIENATPEDLQFFHEKFFLDGLRLLIVSDPVLELFLRRTRRWLCLNAVRLAAENRLEFFERFLCALGEQCFFNEYIYSEPADEKTALENLIGLTPLQSYALTGCYRPLFESFPNHETIFRDLARTSDAFAKLIKTQFFNPMEERKIKTSLKSFGVMENEVSKNVQNQYEENPYPRWISAGIHSSIYDFGPDAGFDMHGKWNILVAGCGTGRHAIATAAMFPNSRVTAIDLSRASLSYARRKADESGVGNRINFVHADILNMGAWPEQFDIIESVGVLHHMEDPFKGWQALVSILKPGGYFKVGLYSEMARRSVVDGRNYVAARGHAATLEGIRACRDSILALPIANDMYRRLISAHDFYTTSLLRDFIFHVQEHRMTLPQIQDMLNRLNLACTGFIVPATETLVSYDSMFPGDPERKNISNWHAFEQKYPDAFITMYQFWCKKA